MERGRLRHLLERSPDLPSAVANCLPRRRSNLRRTGPRRRTRGGLVHALHLRLLLAAAADHDHDDQDDRGGRQSCFVLRIEDRVPPVTPGMQIEDGPRKSGQRDVDLKRRRRTAPVAEQNRADAFACRDRVAVVLEHADLFCAAERVLSEGARERIGGDGPVEWESSALTPWTESQRSAVV